MTHGVLDRFVMVLLLFLAPKEMYLYYCTFRHVQRKGLSVVGLKLQHTTDQKPAKVLMVLHGRGAVAIARALSSPCGSSLYRSSDSVTSARAEVARWYHLL